MKPPCESKCKLLRVATQLVWENSYGSVSVDDICKEAGVRKGSFYYFFPSKADLTIAAMEEDWHQSRARLDEVFSCQTPPVERLERYCDMSEAHQRHKAEEFGKVCGCPVLTLGAELSTLHENIRLKAVEIMERYIKYFESAVRDAQAEGLIQTSNASATARQLFAYSQGVLMDAKIRNDLTLLADMRAGMFQLLNLAPETRAA
ncbi:MAG TPA: TetR/AcrR family transcriptional regulator [Chthoniobacterales bacterium]